jgi:hypothetical protein
MQVCTIIVHTIDVRRIYVHRYIYGMHIIHKFSLIDIDYTLDVYTYIRLRPHVFKCTRIQT